MRVEGLQITKFVCIRGIIGGLWPRDPADSVIPTQILAGSARIFIGVWRRQVFFFDSGITSQPKSLPARRRLVCTVVRSGLVDLRVYYSLIHFYLVPDTRTEPVFASSKPICRVVIKIKVTT